MCQLYGQGKREGAAVGKHNRMRDMTGVKRVTVLCGRVLIWYRDQQHRPGQRFCKATVRARLPDGMQECSMLPVQMHSPSGSEGVSTLQQSMQSCSKRHMHKYEDASRDQKAYADRLMAVNNSCHTALQAPGRSCL